MTAIESAIHADAAAIDGARNLLFECVGLRSGQSLLIVTEPGDSQIFAPELVHFVADAARRFGGVVTLLETALVPNPDDLPPAVTAAIGSADHTLFLSRLGDQLRFSMLPGSGSRVMSHVVELAQLSDIFGRLPYRFLSEVHDRIVERLATTRRIEIRSPLGTALTADFDSSHQPALSTPRLSAFTLKTFPVMITPAISAATLSGRLVASLALNSTVINDSAGHVLPLAVPVAFELSNGRIKDITGDADIVASVRQHAERIAALSGGEPYQFSSFHTGINPTTLYTQPALQDLDRWTTVAFGSPRYSHFHFCGKGLGDLSAKVFEPTISLDGESLWADGRLEFLQRPDIAQIAARYGIDLQLLRAVRDIGI
jgi:hypothetical protein